MVEHLSHHLKVKGLSPRPVSGTGRENGKQFANGTGCSTVVEHLPHHLKVGLSSTTSGANGNAKMAGRGNADLYFLHLIAKYLFYFILFNAKG